MPRYRRSWCVLLAAVTFGVPLAAAPACALQPADQRDAGAPYYPARDRWEHRRPAEVGMDDDLLRAAVEWAMQQRTDMPRDFSTQEETFGKLLGPIPASRADTNGVIVRRGYIIAEFGDVLAADPTYSVAKSYLSTVLGLAIDHALIRSVREPVKDYVHDGGYDSPHNSTITWEHHATQTSEWEGELFGKPHTFIGREAFGKGERPPREQHEPGAYYEYNDVRVNRLSLSLLRVWKRPLPEVLKAEIMDPIGASTTWSWRGYDNSTVDVETDTGTRPIQSVSGGTRWGGGLWMSTLDHARFGLLILRRGLWPDEHGGTRQIISEEWIRQATTQRGGPGTAAPGAKRGYGYLWWLNTEDAWPGSPRTSFAALGAGNNSIWIDPEHDLVVVWRWHRAGDAQAEYYRKILAAIKP